MDDVSQGRSIDIELGGQEVITIDLGNLDPNPEDVLDLLKDGQCKIWVWTRLAGEYWRRGYLDAAERIALTAVECAIYFLCRPIEYSNFRKPSIRVVLQWPCHLCMHYLQISKLCEPARSRS